MTRRSGNIYTVHISITGSYIWSTRLRLDLAAGDYAVGLERVKLGKLGHGNYVSALRPRLGHGPAREFRRKFTVRRCRLPTFEVLWSVL